MRLKTFCEVYLVLVLIEISTAATTRDKRTIDLVLRSVADAFGYDIQKRPPALPPAPSTAAPVVSTFFPPPVAPLPPGPRIFPLAPRASLPPPKAAAPALPARPPKAAPPPPPPPRVPILPILPVPAPVPKAPPPPPPKAPVPPPPPPPPKRPATLTETIRKTFNLNFNWDKNVQPGGPAAAPPPAPGPGPAPAVPKPPVAAAAPPPPPALAPQPAAAPAPPVAQRPGPGGQVFLHKPQLYQQYDYLNIQATPQTLGQGQEPYDYADYQNQQISPDYAEAKRPKATEADLKHAKEKFKESVQEFWKAYPLTEQQGYKYIASQRAPEEKAQFSQSFPKQASKYEEYELRPAKIVIANTAQQEHNCPPQKTHLAKAPPRKYTEVIYNPQPKTEKAEENEENEEYEEEAYIYLLPQDYSDYSNEDDPAQLQEEAQEEESAQHDAAKQPVKQNEEENKPERIDLKQLILNQNQEEDEDEEETVYFIAKRPRRPVQIPEQRSPSRELQADQEKETSQYTEERRPNRVEPIATKRNSNEIQQEAGTVAHPLYSGFLPPQLHHLVQSESQSKPWSVPFDYNIAGTETKSKVVKKYDEDKADDEIYHYECCDTKRAADNFDFYTVPEPKRVDYSRYEKLHELDEDDGKLSKNAKIITNEKKVSVIKTNKYENPVKY